MGRPCDGGDPVVGVGIGSATKHAIMLDSNYLLDK